VFLKAKQQTINEELSSKINKIESQLVEQKLLTSIANDKLSSIEKLLEQLVVVATNK
jgi:hypothetical protein